MGNTYVNHIMIRPPRFIPTRMGNTQRLLIPFSLTSVHPHTHGEHVSVSAASRKIAGSSPHAWGTPDRTGCAAGGQRFIPTRMGNTFYQLIYIATKPVHPHTHGEHDSARWAEDVLNGSSPHAWGTRRPGTALCYPHRFIPTRMGNTSFTAASLALASVHPHTHGEHAGPVSNGITSYGSSPHAWGTQSRRLNVSLRLRFIPTRMGNTGV